MADVIRQFGQPSGFGAEAGEGAQGFAAQFFRIGLGPFEAARLRTEAEEMERRAPDTVRFTRALKAATALEDRSDLMTALWSVAIADGLRDAEEDRLMRMVANLLGLTDVQNAQARQRAERAE